MKEYWKYKRGSEWRRWDLHIHTPYSYLNNEFGSNFDDYVLNLFKKAIENNIAVIGITDYFCIEGYKKIKQDYIEKEDKLKELFTDDEINKIKEIKLFPNIEFRLDKLVNSHRINYHVILSDNVTIIDIEENFLHELEFVYEGNPYGEDEKWKLKLNNLENLGKKLKQEHHSFQDKSDLFIGMMNAVVKDDDITKILTNKKSKFKDKFILVVPADEDLSKISWDSQGHNLRKVLIQKSHAFFSSNKETIKWGLGKKSSSKKEYIQEFKTLKPTIWGSDAHNFDKLFLPDNNNFCWIKADPTFEGLKQILYEPEGRVKIQPLKPEQKNEQYIISKIKFKSSDKLFGNKEILLNENLNAIIGGKSSGKSLLLHSIAESIDPVQVERISKRLGFEGYKFEEDFDFEVTWKNGNKDILKDREPENKKHKITYIPQLYINYLAEKNNKEELNSLVGNILLQDAEFKLFYEFRINQIEKISKNLETELFDLLSYKDDYFKYAKELKEIGSSKSISEAIKKLEQQIATIHKLSNLSQEEINSYKELLKEKEKLENKLTLIKIKEKVLNEYIKELNETKNNLFGIHDTEYFLSKKGILEKLLDNFKEIPSDIQDIHLNLKSDYDALISKLINEISKLNLSQQSAGIIDEIKKIVNALKPYLKKFEGQKEIKKIDEKLKFEKEKKTKAEMLEKKLDNLKIEYKNVKQRIKSLLSQRYTLYQEIVTDINNKRNKIGSDITLQCSLQYKKNYFSLYEQANKAAISQDHEFKNLFIGDNVNYDLIPDFFVKAENVTEDNFLVVKNEEDKSYLIPLKQNTTIDKIFKGLIIDKFELDYKVTYKNDELLNMSPGKKGTVLLILFLQISSAEYPILIDQPEDNLDNRTIYELLCKIVKETKTKRQIIIVSHNANLVVSTDSENIIVANQEGQDPDKEKSEHRFEYVNGAIEYSSPRDEKIKGVLYQQGIKEHVCDILEGGNEAFKQREKKYAI